MHLVNILDCEKSKLFTQGTLFHSELFIWFHLDLVSQHYDCCSLFNMKKDIGFKLDECNGEQKEKL